MFKNTSNHAGIFRSESSLTTGYTLAQPATRTVELRRLQEAIQPIVHRKPPENLLVYGPAGGGKTTVVKHVLSELTSKTRVTTAHINCWQYNTRPSLLPELLRQLNYPQPRKGKPVDELLEKLREWLNKHYGAIVVLDEFDQLKDPSAIIYDLKQSSEDATSFLGLVLISNQPPSQLQLEPRSQSRLSYQPLEFRPYTKQELVAILEQRVEDAFRNGTASEHVIKKIATTVAEQNGDCREALTLLLRTGRQAEQENADRLTTDHVEVVLSSETGI